MTKLSIIVSPDPILKTKSNHVEKMDKELQRTLDDMLETMYHEDGAGLAAVQVGLLKRIFVLDVGRKDNERLKDPQFYINPEIIYCSEEEIAYSEGCLSFPGARSVIYRPRVVKIKYLDYDGNQCEEEADDYKARGFLHEIDHLDGVTMADHLSPIKRNVFIRKVTKNIRNMN